MWGGLEEKSSARSSAQLLVSGLQSAQTAKLSPAAASPPGQWSARRLGAVGSLADQSVPLFTPQSQSQPQHPHPSTPAPPPHPKVQTPL